MIERYRRGFFGWVFLLIFWGWNLLMAYAIIMGIGGQTPSIFPGLIATHITPVPDWPS